MLTFPMKVLYFILGLTVTAGVIGYGVGLFDPYLRNDPVTAGEPAAPKDGRLENKPAPIASIPAPDAPGTKEPAAGGTMPAPESPATPPAAAELIVPSFDLVRVEPNGSLLVAGKAAPEAVVEVVTGTRVLARAESSRIGDFVAVLEDRLEPGDYQIVLRSTTPDNVVVTSLETAIVSIPDNKDGQVLAIVEQPGAPSKLITVPAAEKPAEQPSSPPAASAPEAPATAEAPPAAQPPQGNVAATEPAPSSPSRPAQRARVAVEAVEIEGRTIFVAGLAEAGRYVRVYANELLLGETQASAAGRFLVETERDLPVGDYIIRADMLGDDRSTVIARATVPFEREAGENIAAVAPAEPPATPRPPANDSPPLAAPAPVTEAPPQPAAPSPGGQNASDTPAAPATAEKEADAPKAEGEAAAKEEPMPGEPDTVAAPKLERSEAAVIIRRGDTLWRISRRVYGQGIRYSTIYLANQDQIQNPNRIWPGQVFAMPDESADGTKANWDALGQQLTEPKKPAVN